MKGCISKRLRYIQKLYLTAIIGMYALALLRSVIMFSSGLSKYIRQTVVFCTTAHFFYRILSRERGTISLMHFVR